METVLGQKLMKMTVPEVEIWILFMNYSIYVSSFKKIGGSKHLIWLDLNTITEPLAS